MKENEKTFTDEMDKFLGNLESYGIEVECKYRFTNIHHSEYTRYDYVIFVDENGNELEDKGYLDHGGEAKDLVDYVLSSPENTIKFIFDNRCFINTGNDNTVCIHSGCNPEGGIRSDSEGAGVQREGSVAADHRHLH